MGRCQCCMQQEDTGYHGVRNCQSLVAFWCKDLVRLRLAPCWRGFAVERLPCVDRRSYADGGVACWRPCRPSVSIMRLSEIAPTNACDSMSVLGVVVTKSASVTK